MKKEKKEIFESLHISYIKRSNGNNYYSKAELNIKGYIVKLESIYYKELQQAVDGIKERITKAYVDFDITEK